MSDKIYQFIAYHLPLRLKYFVCIDVWSKTTIGDYSDTDCTTLTVTEMIKRIQSESDIETIRLSSITPTPITNEDNLK